MNDTLISIENGLDFRSERDEMVWGLKSYEFSTFPCVSYGFPRACAIRRESTILPDILKAFCISLQRVLTKLPMIFSLPILSLFIDISSYFWLLLYTTISSSGPIVMCGNSTEIEPMDM